jgi:diguanylate cyclase (GGDEF)-like protein
MSRVTAVRTATRAPDVVPLSRRVGAMVAFRVVYLTVLHAVLFTLDVPHQGRLLAATGVYLGVTSLLSASVWLPSETFARKASGIALLVDGVWVTYLREALGHRAGVDIGPLALLVAVVLLASFRTGLKIALWLSVLFLLALKGQETGLFPTPYVAPGALDGEQRLVVDLLSLWLVTVTTAAAAAASERELKLRRYDAEVLARFAERLHLDARVEEVAADLVRFAVAEQGAERAVVVRTTPSAVQLLADTAAPVAGADRRRFPAVLAQGPDAVASAMLDLPRRDDGVAAALRLDPARDAWLASLLPDARRLLVADLTDTPSERIVLVVVLGGGRHFGGRAGRQVLQAVAQAARTASLAWSRAELLVAAERRAATDGLTGLANRRTFDETLAALQADFESAGTPYALVLTDVDKFKSVNDRYGHQAGDEVLQIVARLLMEQADVVGATAARYGGEEFAVLWAGASSDEAAALAERVRVALQDVREPVPVTSSFGVAAVPEHCTGAAALVHASDAALIHAKNTGRNRVVVASDHAMPADGPDFGDVPGVPAPRRRDLRPQTPAES